MILVVRHKGITFFYKTAKKCVEKLHLYQKIMLFLTINALFPHNPD